MELAGVAAPDALLLLCAEDDVFVEGRLLSDDAADWAGCLLKSLEMAAGRALELSLPSTLTTSASSSLSTAPSVDLSDE